MRPTLSRARIVMLDVSVGRTVCCRCLMWPKFRRFAGEIGIPRSGADARCIGTLRSHALRRTARRIPPIGGCVEPCIYRKLQRHTYRRRGSAMSKRVADVLVETLQAARVKTCYGMLHGEGHDVREMVMKNTRTACGE